VLPVEGNLPSFVGATGWLNSPPLTPEGLRGKVVAVDFCTYTCINWLRTLSHIRAWTEKAWLDAQPRGHSVGSNDLVSYPCASVPREGCVSKYLIRNISDTALLVAACRAIEAERSDALFDDPLAARLAGDRGCEIARSMPHREVTLRTVAIRTVVVDRFLTSAIDTGVGTVLNLAAGLDTRPYRMSLPSSLRWIEVDQANIIEMKERLLRGETPKCEVQRVALDLTLGQDRRKLFERIGSTSSSTIVITEGFITYLDREAVATLAADLFAQPIFALWVTDYFSPAVTRWRTASIWGTLDRLRRKRRSTRNAPFRFVPGDWERFFADQGWRLKEMKYLGEESGRLQRSVPMPWFVRPLRPFMSGTRRQDMLRMTGYALLERSLDGPLE
jgi:methyltransferase (TIGR00027 family)